MDSLYIVMPAYNEEDNIRDVVEAWYSVLEGKDEKSKLVVADSGSRDKTHEILAELQKSHPQLEIFTDCDRQHGPKLIAMYKYAIENGADYIFQTDSDGQTDPDEFDAFWQERNTYDCILGNRTVRGDGKDRAFVEHVVCFMLKLYYGVKVPDANAPFRLMKTDVVEKYIGRFEDDYNIPNIMLTTFFSYYHEKLEFREISFKPRTAGTNSVNVSRIIKTGWKALGDFHDFKKAMKS